MRHRQQREELKEEMAREADRLQAEAAVHEEARTLGRVDVAAAKPTVMKQQSGQQPSRVLRAEERRQGTERLKRLREEMERRKGGASAPEVKRPRGPVTAESLSLQVGAVGEAEVVRNLRMLRKLAGGARRRTLLELPQLAVLLRNKCSPEGGEVPEAAVGLLSAVKEGGEEDAVDWLSKPPRIDFICSAVAAGVQGAGDLVLKICPSVQEEDWESAAGDHALESLRRVGREKEVEETLRKRA
eukprot:Hpha_TRINITY_DN9539_c0_g1::TRINITY_DN9539_c0_g1_i2::g.114815::m.114815